jgi:hypothetical protein
MCRTGIEEEIETCARIITNKTKCMSTNEMKRGRNSLHWWSCTWVLFHTCACFNTNFIADVLLTSRRISLVSRPPWSRGNVPTSWSEWRGFKPGGGRRNFKDGKIQGTKSFGRDFKPFDPCSRYTARKRTPSPRRGPLGQIYPHFPSK